MLIHTAPSPPLSPQEESGALYPDMEESHMYESLQLQYEELYMFLKENSRKSKVSSEWEWENEGLTRVDGWVGRKERGGWMGRKERRGRGEWMRRKERRGGGEGSRREEGMGRKKRGEWMERKERRGRGEGRRREESG